MEDLDLEHKKPFKYPEEDSAEKKRAKEDETAARVARGEPASLNACPFCNRAVNGNSAVLKHLQPYMSGKQTDDAHTMEGITDWILNHDSRPHRKKQD